MYCLVMTMADMDEMSKPNSMPPTVAMSATK